MNEIKGGHLDPCVARWRTIDRSFDVARPVKPIGRQDREGEVYMSDGKVRCALVTGG